MEHSELQQLLLKAHEADDTDALAGLYATAADAQEAAGNTDAACFYLTQAYVYALDAGSSQTHTLNRRLAAYGREQLR